MSGKLSTERLARWSAVHRRRVLAVWGAAFVVSIAVIAVLLNSALTSENTFVGSPDSKRADDLISQRLPGGDRLTEVALVRSSAQQASDAGFRSRVEGLRRELLALGPAVVTRVGNPYAPGGAALVSRDHDAVILPVTLTKDRVDAADDVPALRAVVAKGGGDGFATTVSGLASIDHDFSKVAENDLQKGEGLGLPIALLILLPRLRRAGRGAAADAAGGGLDRRRAGAHVAASDRPSSSPSSS